MQDRIRVLLADDHAVVRKGIRQFLEEAGDIEVIAEADDGAEALRLVEEHKPDQAEGMIKALGKACRALAALPVPVVAMVHGACLGGAVCDPSD